MRSILFCVLLFIPLTMTGCGSARSTVVDAVKNAEPTPNLYQYQSALQSATKAINTQKGQLTDAQAAIVAANQKIATGQAIIAQGQLDLVNAHKLQKIEEEANAKKWRTVFIIFGTLIQGLGLAAFIFVSIEHWPFKWLYILLGAIGTSLDDIGFTYYAVAVYGEYILWGLVALALVVFYYIWHTHSAFLSRTANQIQVTGSDLSMMAKKTAKRWGIGYIEQQVIKEIK